jgi:hypothetical protein
MVTALALKENGFISSRAALWKVHPLQKQKQIKQARARPEIKPRVSVWPLSKRHSQRTNQL